MANAPATLQASVSSNSRRTIRAVAFRSRAVRPMSRLAQVVAGRGDHGLGLLDSRLLECGGIARALPEMTGMPSLNRSKRSGAWSSFSITTTCSRSSSSSLNDLKADAADAGDHHMIAAERGEHAIPLRLILLAAEHQEGKPDHRVGDRAQPDDGKQEKERLEIPLVRKVERRLEEDQQEDGVAGAGERQRFVLVERPEYGASANHQGGEDHERPAKFPEQIPDEPKIDPEAGPGWVDEES